MFEITRLWGISDYDLKPNIEILYKRPRIDYRISEYIFDYINKKILEPNKIMQTGNYKICFSFKFYNKEDHNYHEDTIFCTENTKYSFHLFISTENGIKYKVIMIFCNSTELTEKTNPNEYANIVYDMMGAFLTSKYKKISKETIDKNRNGMDYNLIESFEFPAPFENQKYLVDNPGIVKWGNVSNGKKIVLIEIDIRKKYIEYYGY
jgi:hypothetical protein